MTAMKPGPAESSNSVLYDSALALGASSEDAVAFSRGELLSIDGVPICVVWPNYGKVSWLALAWAPIERPAQMDADRWNERLLRANAATTATGCMGFSLDDDGDGALLLQIEPNYLLYPNVLAMGLRGMVTVCNSLIESEENASTLGEST